MNTVKTIETDGSRSGWVFYDGQCRFCYALARFFRTALRHKQFQLEPLQTAWVGEKLGLPPAELMSEMRLLTASGRLFGGADAVLELARSFWWAFPLRLLAGLPFGTALVHRAYQWIAAHRHCGANACALPSQKRAAGGASIRGWDYLPLFALPVVALGLSSGAPAWVVMWSVACGLFLGLKWLACREAGGRKPGVARLVGFIALWPGMDARKFLTAELCSDRGTRREWMLALFKTALGAGLVWALARRAFVIAPLLAAWVGMIGLAFGLHFGLFHLLSLAWRSRGVDAPRLMDAPLRAKSLAEFWGRRWNLGFSVPARRLLFQPLAARMGNARAALAVFLVSGWLHELVISLPARGGFGLPTAYFALQGVAGIFERSAVGRRWGLGRGWRGGLFTLAITGGPVFWLFHPPFARRVILPFLQSLGAL